MALPSNVGQGIVVWHTIDNIGAVIEGTVTFTASPKKLQNVTATPNPVTILPKPITVTLNDGAFSQSLVATDDEDNNPHGWTYRVTFKLVGVVVDAFDIEVPEGATVDLAVVAPVSSGNGTQIVARGVVPGGGSGQVLAKSSGADYDTEWVDPAAGGGGAELTSYATQVESLGDYPTTFPSAIADVSGLAAALTGKAADSAVVKLSGNQTVAGVKTFSSAPLVPDSSFAQAKVVNLAADLAAKAPTASPTFTGTVTGVTKAHVGLGSVDNTADSAKSVASAATLTTARTINGVSFNGSANITVADATKVPTTRTVAGKALSADVTLTASDVGARPSTYTPSVADLPAGSTIARVYNAGWPARGTSRTDVTVQWIGGTEATPPTAGVAGVDVWIRDAGV